MRAILLAAGQGSRLRPLTDRLPKCLVELAGHPLLRWQLDSLAAAGVDELALVTGYRAEAIRVDGASLVHNPRWGQTNMVASLACAAELLQGEVLIAYTDIVYSPELAEATLLSTADVGVTVDLRWRELWDRRMEDPLTDAETLRLSDDRARIIEIGAKPEDLDEIEGQYIGMVRLSASGSGLVRACLESARRDPGDPFRCGRGFDRAYLTDLLMYLIRQGATVSPILVEGGWCEIDSPKDLSVAEELMAEGAFGIPSTVVARS